MALDPGPATPAPAERSSRPRRLYESAYGRGTAVYDHGRLWIENQDPASRKGATIGWVRRYQAADGQLYAVLLAAYFFLTVIPLVLRSSIGSAWRAPPRSCSTACWPARPVTSSPRR
jgi:hypothetical protein